MAREDGPSLHLTWAELACVDGTPYPLAWRETRARALAEMFEAYRGLLGGRPLTVLSAYRTTEHNAKVGGAAEGQHPEGTALDILRPADLSYGFVVQCAFKLAEVGMVTGIGVYSHAGSIHLDQRPGELAVWAK